MIKEKYIPLFLSHQIGEITTIIDTHKLGTISPHAIEVTYNEK